MVDDDDDEDEVGCNWWLNDNLPFNGDWWFGNVEDEGKNWPFVVVKSDDDDDEAELDRIFDDDDWWWWWWLLFVRKWLDVNATAAAAAAANDWGIELENVVWLLLLLFPLKWFIPELLLFVLLPLFIGVPLLLLLVLLVWWYESITDDLIAFVGKKSTVLNIIVRFLDFCTQNRKKTI